MKTLRKIGFYITLLCGVMIFHRYYALPTLAQEHTDSLRSRDNEREYGRPGTYPRNDCVTAMHGHFVDTPIDKSFLNPNKANA